MVFFGEMPENACPEKGLARDDSEENDTGQRKENISDGASYAGGDVPPGQACPVFLGFQDCLQFFSKVHKFVL